MTGTDRSVGLGRRIGSLGLVVGLALAGVAGPGPVSAQETQVVTIRSGSGWIGVNVSVVTSPTEDVITLTDVLAGSPAAEAGLEPGDRVIRVNGVPVTSERFRSITSRLEAGDPISLTVLRSGEEVDLSVVAGQRPEPAQIVAVRLQQELDSVRSHFVRILESPEGRALRVVEPRSNRFVEAPTIRVEQVGSDSIATRVLIHGEAGQVFTYVETPEGIQAAEVLPVPRPGAVPSPPEAEQLSREAERQARLEAEARGQEVRSLQEGEPVWVPLRRDLLEAAEREEVRRQAEIRGQAWPTRSIEEVRPLSPYLAGLTRVAGAELRTLNPGLAQYFGVERGLLVTEVSEGTPAAEAGLQGGDVIVTAGGREVTTLDQLRESLSARGGRELEVIRAGERRSITLR